VKSSDNLKVAMHPVLTYTAARVAVFALTAGILWLVLPVDKGKPEGVLLLLAAAVFISGIVSYVLLARQRVAMSTSVAEGVRRQRKKLHDSRTSEDA
jgi:uncharacterized protein DUF4229